jgi:hypothetical protein
MTNTQQYLKETIDLLVLEILGKFNFTEFKKIAMTNVRARERSGSKPWDMSGGEHPEIQYATRLLPKLGSGSSRTVFALSGGTVLKIAKNNAGIGQNKEELDTYTRLKDNSLVTKIFDYAQDYKWLVSEIVKPIDGADFEKYVGMPGYEFWQLFEDIKAFGVEGYFTRDIENLQRKIEMDEREIANTFDEHWKKYLINSLQNKKEQLKRLEDAPRDSFVLNLAKKIDDFIKKSGLHPGDITRTDHFGRNANGEIKLLDYGFSYDVEKKYYDRGASGGGGPTGNSIGDDPGNSASNSDIDAW